MAVLVKPVGMLKDYVQGQEEAAVEPGQTVRQALQALGIPSELVALVSVNGVHQMKDYVLQDGDEVRLLAVMGGG